MAMSLVRLEIENLRGFQYAQLQLERKNVVLVGKNNSGKTSALLLLDWLFNDPDILDLLEGNKSTSPEICSFLLPARQTRAKARRLTLYFKVHNRKRWGRFSCDEEGIAQLRINLRNPNNPLLFAKLGAPTRSEVIQSDKNALALLREIRDKQTFIYIPSFRDVNSPRFQRTSQDLFQETLAERAIHKAQAGAPSEYRQVSKALTNLEEVVTSLLGKLWEQLRQKHLPPGLVQSAQIELIPGVEEMVDWLAQNVRLRLSTGSHDEQTVAATSVGAGLQSLLDVAFATKMAADSQTTILAIEEPEAFLHPSAQRVIARMVLGTDVADKVLVTTHSPIIVEEAQYSDIVLTYEQKYFHASSRDERRCAINTAYIRGRGAEMVFAGSVLLVEGESDMLFFENLRRRLASCDLSGRVDNLYVLSVGSVTQFAPWIRLLESFRHPGGERPIKWTVAPDSDSLAEIKRAFRDATFKIPQQALEHFQDIETAYQERDVTQWQSATRKFNRLKLADSALANLWLLPCDLEFAALQAVSNPTLRAFEEQIDSEPYGTKDDLLRKLGSKGVDGRARDNATKSPWIRGVLGDMLPPSEVHEDITGLLELWMSGVMLRSEAGKVLKDFQS